MNIENLNDDLGKCALHVNNEIIFFDTECIQLATYQIYSNIQHFENTGSIIVLNNRAIISLIFVALENYIGAILKAISITDSSIDYEYLSKQGIDSRIKELINKLNGDDIEIYKNTNIINLINELCTFRNELFHDRRRKPKYSHTNFPSDTYKINIEDTIEALKIFIDLCKIFSKSIIKLNLMPNIIMYKGNTTYYERLDTFYDKLIKEYYTKVLEKYSLTTNRIFELLDYYNWTNRKYSSLEIEPIIKAKPDDSTVFLKVHEKTNIGYTLYQEIIDKKILSEENFGIPNYTDN